MMEQLLQGRFPDEEVCEHDRLTRLCVVCLNEAVHEQWERAEAHERTITSMMTEIAMLREQLGVYSSWEVGNMDDN